MVLGATAEVHGFIGDTDGVTCLQRHDCPPVHSPRTRSRPSRSRSVRTQSLGLSIILSINSRQPGHTRAHLADKSADHRGLGGLWLTSWTAYGPLAVSPIRPLSHLSTWPFALQRGTVFHALSIIATRNPYGGSIRERSPAVRQADLSWCQWSRFARTLRDGLTGRPCRTSHGT